MKNVIFIFAHNDDEFFVSTLIKRELDKKNNVHVVYITYGSLYNRNPEVRIQESLKTLTDIGVQESNILFLGKNLNIMDSEALENMETLGRELKSNFSCQIDKIYLPTWEGGHPDHDVAHIIGMGLKKDDSTQMLEFSLYNRYRCFGPFFRVMRLIPLEVDNIIEIKLSYAEVFKMLSYAWNYKSQWKTFIGLFPFTALKLLTQKKYEIRLTDQRDYSLRPHKGKLLYETRFGVSFEKMKEKIKVALDTI